MMMNNDKTRLFNIVILGISFMFVFTGFQTISVLQLQDPDNVGDHVAPEHGGDRVTLSVVYSVMAAFSCLAPPLLVTIGPRTCLMIGASFYILYCGQLINSSTMMVYTTAVLLGAGAAIIWVGQGFMLASQTLPGSRYRDVGVFWALFHCSGVVGNVLVHYSDTMHAASDNLLGVVLVCVSSAGVVTMTLFRGDTLDTAHMDGVMHCLTRVCTLLTSRVIITLAPTIILTGLMQTFQSSILRLNIRQFVEIQLHLYI